VLNVARHCYWGGKVMTRSALGLAASLCVLAATVAACQKNPQQAAAPSAAPPATAAANVQPQLTPGSVQSASASQLTIVGPNGGAASFQLSPGTVIMIAHKGTVADIKPGSFIGTTNVPSADGTGQSTEVHIFPAGVKMGEGDRPMGPPPAAGAQASRMTNGTVSSAAPAAGASNARMTNGSVSTASTSNAGMQMDVAYEGGHRQITVPATTPVMVMTSATPDMLKPGTNVLVGFVPGPNGAKAATFINVQP
jgi:hypothetical protein